ncbi:conserved hypothetical protein, partial [Ricinus communis]
MFDDFTEGLAGYVGATEYFQSGRGPGFSAAGQHRHVGPAETDQLVRAVMGLALIAIDDHDAGIAAGNQAVDVQRQAPARCRDSEQQMAARIDAGISHIQQGNLLAVRQRGLEVLRGNAGVADPGRRAEGAIAAASTAFKHDARRHMVETAAVEVQMQAGLVALQFDGMDIVGAEDDRIAKTHIDRTFRRERVARGIGGLVPAIEDIALHALHAADDGPGRMVVRQDRLARQCGRQVQRKAAVGLFAEAVDHCRMLLVDREILFRKQRSLAAEGFEMARHRFQILATGLRRIANQLTG